MVNQTDNSSEAGRDKQCFHATSRPTYKPIIDHLSNQESSVQGTIAFDPTQHLTSSTNQTMPKTISMEEIGYPKGTGISDIAVSMPFKLFSNEAIQQMRREIFQPEVMENCSFSSNIAACQLRGYAKKYAPFTYEAWTHPDTLALISKIAGTDLRVWGDYEIAHINLSVKTDEQTEEEVTAINRQKRMRAEDEGIQDCPWEDDKPVVGWHRDAYAFVCVLMMSDCTNMVGGETALRTPDGRTIKVRGPQEGCAVVLQGRYIDHQALRALGSKERITAVTSFRPRSPVINDDTCLTSVRPISDRSELYYDFLENNLDDAIAALTRLKEDNKASREAGEKFDPARNKELLKAVAGALQHTDNEVIEDDKVIEGLIVQEGMDDVENGAMDDAKSVKRARLD